MEPRAHIESFLRRVRQIRSQVQVLQGVYILLTYVMGSYLLTCLLAWIFQPKVEWVLPAIIIFIGGLVYILFNHLINHFFKSFSINDAALLADSHYPELNNSIISSSQLSRRLKKPQFESEASLEFIRELHKRTGFAINKIDPSTTINKSIMIIFRNWFCGILILLVFTVLFIPDFIEKGNTFWSIQEIYLKASQTQKFDEKNTNLKPVNYSIESISLTFHFPLYTGLKTQSTKSLDGKIHVLPGTEANIMAKMNASLIGADLIFNGKDKYTMKKEGEMGLRGNLLVKEKGFYQFSLKDQKRDKHLLVKKYPVTLVKDQAPNIVLFLANPKPVYFNTDKVQFFYEGRDDFGINSVELVTFINGKIKRIPVKKFKNQKKKAKGSYKWTLAEMGLSPGDQVQYYLEIKDNDNIFGPNTGQSESYSFTTFDSEKEMDSLIAMQEKMTEQMIALLAIGLVEGASLEIQTVNLLGWKQLFKVSIDELIEIVNLAQSIRDRGKSIDQFPQAYLNLLKNIIGGLSNIRRNQIEALSNIESKTYKPTQAKFETGHSYSTINNQMTEHLEKDILYLVKMTNQQKISRAVRLEKELDDLTQLLRDELEKVKDGKLLKNSTSLKNKINKIRKILQKLLDQMARQTQTISNEFLNPSALKALNMENFSNALKKMQKMINEGQVKEALEQLKQMAEDLQLLANHLNRVDSEIDNFPDPETTEALDKASKTINQLINKQKKLTKKTIEINQTIKQRQAKEFKEELNKLFASLIHDIKFIQKLLTEDELFLENYRAIKTLEKLMNEEFKIAQRIKELNQLTIDLTQSENLDKSFKKLNEAKKSHSMLSQKKKSLRVNEHHSFKEALPQLLKKYNSLNELAELQNLKEFANHFKQAYPDVLRWQNRLRSAPNPLDDLAGRINKDMTEVTRLNNEISKKLGSIMHSIKKNYDSSITTKQGKELSQMAKEENQLREETEKLAKQLDKLNRENPIIPPELSNSMTQTGRHMERATQNLQKQNILDSIKSENQALKGLNSTNDILNQMKNSNGKMGKAQRQTPRKLGAGNNPDSQRGGSQRMQSERILLPSEDQYQAPKEFREEILNAMKKQTPKDYQRMVMEYYKNLVK